MSRRKVNSNRVNIGAELAKILEEYSDDITSEITGKLPEIAKETISEIEKKAPRRESGSEGYYLSWDYTTQGSSRYEDRLTIYSNQPGLPHLLEFGHAKRNGGRVDPSPAGGHIAPAEKEAVEKLEKKIREAIEDAN